MAERRDLAVPGRRGTIPARLYVPRNVNATSPGLLDLHGGGFVIGSPDTHDRMTRELAEGIGARVLSLHYALAPEHAYPAGLEDCVDAARWLACEGRSLGIDPARLLIGGDSAGANLTAATILVLRDERAAPAFRAALLIYGRFSADETSSMKAWGDLRGLPPSVLIVGSLDPLLDDSKLFAAALEKVGVPTELHIYDDGLHAFMQFAVLDMCGEALARACAFARRSERGHAKRAESACYTPRRCPGIPQ